DLAGRRAARRALDVVLAEGVPTRVMRLPEQHDPDTFVQEVGPEAFLEQAEAAPELFDAVLEDLCAQSAGAEDRMARVRDLLPALQGAADPMVREAHAEHMAQRLGLPMSVVREALGRLAAAPQRRAEPSAPARDAAPKASRTEVQLASLLIAFPELADSQDMRAALGEFADRDLAAVVETVLDLRARGDDVTAASVHDGVEDRPGAARWLARLSVAEPIWGEADVASRMFADCLEHLRVGSRREHGERLKEAMEAAARRGDLDEARRLNAEWQALVRATKTRGARTPGAGTSVDRTN
ncbi:MAG: hypothetical protein KC466_08850, partial [Myxococcales bacterium]|nr:hypothetical protein [Myxococcales bacterium]